MLHPDELESVRKWTAIGAKIPADVLVEITAQHEADQWNCSGYSEGMWCCIDYLDGTALRLHEEEAERESSVPNG